MVVWALALAVFKKRRLESQLEDHLGLEKQKSKIVEVMFWKDSENFLGFLWKDYRAGLLWSPVILAAFGLGCGAFEYSGLFNVVFFGGNFIPVLSVSIVAVGVLLLAYHRVRSYIQLLRDQQAAQSGPWALGVIGVQAIHNEAGIQRTRLELFYSVETSSQAIYDEAGGVDLAVTDAGVEGGNYDAVVVVSFGGPEGPADVLPFLENVTRGRNIPPERLAEVAKVYEAHGGVSPLNEQNRDLAARLEAELRERGHGLPVYLGNRNWHPYLADTFEQLRQAGVKRALALVTSAFSSYSSCRQYLEDMAAAGAVVGDGVAGRDNSTAELVVHKLRAFHNHPRFVELQAEVVAQAVGQLLEQGLLLEQTRVVFTAHSLPLSQAQVCDYEAQLRETARLVMDSIDWAQLAQGHGGVASSPTETVQPHGWDLVWQSRSGPPQVKWLEPDIGDHLPAVAFFGSGPNRDGRCLGVVAAPLGFLSDHMEVINDLDQVASQVAQDFNLKFQRAATVSAADGFVELVADLVEERLLGLSERPSVGELAVAPDFCPVDCCVVPAG